jgi:hypothetical protein
MDDDVELFDKGSMRDAVIEFDPLQDTKTFYPTSVVSLHQRIVPGLIAAGIM